MSSIKSTLCTISTRLALPDELAMAESVAILSLPHGCVVLTHPVRAKWAKSVTYDSNCMLL